VKLNGLGAEVTDFNIIGERAYSNKFGTGCLVTVTLDDGTKMQQHVYAGSGYLGSNEPTVHFGLGDYESVKSVEVLWSTGITQKVNNIDADQILVIDESSNIFFSLFGLTIPENQGIVFCAVLLFVFLLGNKLGIFNKNEINNDELVSQQSGEE
jgi:hypothetical protein